MTVDIHDLNYDPPRIRVLHSEDDADGALERSLYQMVLALGDVVTCGRVIALPQRFNGSWLGRWLQGSRRIVDISDQAPASTNQGETP